jgi:uncharacterized protein YycO
MKQFLQAKILIIAGWISRHILTKLTNPFNKKHITSRDYRTLKEKCIPGTILLSTTRGEITNLFIPGKYKHAAIVVNENEVTEAVGKGVIRTDLIDFLMTKDYVIALNPLFAKPSEMKKAAQVAIDQEGKDYDFDIILSDFESFYCSELIYFAYDEVIEGIPFVPREVMGRDTIIPSDFLAAETKFSVIWESDSVRKLRERK